MLVAGVDDAGRGCVIGPLVIAAVLMKVDDLPKLAELGVKDSKCLSPKERSTFAVEIRRIAAKINVKKLLPEDIDIVVETGRRLHKLNRLEAQAMAEVIGTLKPDVAFVDASDVSEDRFRQHVLESLSFRIRIISEHKADMKYPIVSAASVIAKVERDKEVEKLKEIYGDLGCGYPSDPKTLSFLRGCLEKFGGYPDCVRRSWKTAKKIRSERGSLQQRLI